MNNKHMITAFAIALLIYAGFRSFDYMSGSLLGIGQTTAYLVAIVFLFASEIGLLIWLHVARPHATTDIQETVSTAMIFINFIGSMILGLADLLKHNTLYTVDVSFLDPVLLFAPWVLIVANVGGYLIYHMADSDEQLSRAERRLHHEEVRLEMTARQKAIEELKSNMDGLADRLAPNYFKDITNRVEGRTAKRFAKVAKASSDLPLESFISGNGSGKTEIYNAEVATKDFLSVKPQTRRSSKK